MCFSAEADFVSAAVIGAVGVATLREVEHKRELPLAVLPLAFAAHQFSEGFVWLGLDGSISKSVGDIALYAYVFYAWAILPFLAPLAVMLVEPLRSRRKIMSALVVLGAGVGIFLLWTVATSSITAHITGNTIQYRGVGDSGDFVTALYVIATCGTFLISTQRRIRWFGVANSVAVALIAWEQKDGLTSLWCLWGAIVSVLIYFQFLDWRRDERAHTGIRAALRA
jgi:uncharacterized protein DUF6629